MIRGRTVILDNTAEDLRNHHIADGSGLNPAPSFFVSTDPVPNPSGNEVHNNVFTRDLNFTLKAGRYYPSEIATIITDKMGTLDSLGTVGYDVTLNKYPVESPFMSTIHQIDHLVTDVTKLNKELNYNPSIPNPDEEPFTLMTFDLTGVTSIDDPVIGANEVSLNYDNTLKKLNFDALHFPFYVGSSGGTGGQPGTIYPALPPVYLQPNPPGVGQNTPVPHIPQTSYGGVFFTKLEPKSFWVDQLGFSNILVKPEVSDILMTGRQKPDTTALPDIYPVKVNLTPGKNIVTGFNGLDNIIPKSDIAWIPVLGEVSTALTTPIISSREFDTPVVDEGFYLIEVAFSFPQKMIGGSIEDSTTSNAVMGVMGKYFTSGNFLQSQGQGAVVYQHKGEPTLLSDLRVSVKNPNGTLPSNNDLGRNNSIFLEVVKQVQPTPPPPN